MDWSSIGAWAGDKGPYLFIIAVMARIIFKLLDRFFEQQAVLTNAMKNSGKAIDHAERSGSSDV